MTWLVLTLALALPVDGKPTKTDSLSEAGATVSRLTGVSLELPDKKTKSRAATLAIEEGDVRIEINVPQDFELHSAVVSPPLLGIEIEGSVETWKTIEFRHETGATVHIERVPWKFRPLRDGDLEKMWDGRFRLEWYPELKFGTVPVKRQSKAVQYLGRKGYRHPVTTIPNAYRGHRGWQNVALFTLQPVGEPDNVGFTVTIGYRTDPGKKAERGADPAVRAAYKLLTKQLRFVKPSAPGGTASPAPKTGQRSR